MSFIDNFFISIFSKEIGKDQFGNKYYESKKLDYLGQARRQVVYKGKVEASKVPPMWHAWLHYMINEVPINNRPLAKLAYAEEFEGDASPRTAAYSSVREDSSTASLSKLPAEVELGKRSNDKFDWQQDYLPNLTGTSLSHKIVKNKTTKAEYSRWQPLGESNLGESK